jgi:cbb3-type cytochrome oxidase subunit 1
VRQKLLVRDKWKNLRKDTTLRSLYLASSFFTAAALKHEVKVFVTEGCA